MTNRTIEELKEVIERERELKGRAGKGGGNEKRIKFAQCDEEHSGEEDEEAKGEIRGGKAARSGAGKGTSLTAGRAREVGKGNSSGADAATVKKVVKVSFHLCS